MFFFSIMIC